MSGMFSGCDSLNFIDISNFDMTNCNSYSNMFSLNNNLKFINLYNTIDTNNILSDIFSGISNLYICIKSNNIINSNIYNCCDYNYESNECNYKIIKAGPQNINSPVSSTVITPDSSSGNPSSTSSTGTSNDGTSSNNYAFSSYSSKSSSSKSTGVIIGVIAGVVVLIAIVATIICICRRMKKKNSKDNNKTINETEDIIIPDNLILVKLVTTSQYKIQIQIEPEKKMSDLIKAYFAQIKKPELFGDFSIRFLVNGKMVEHNSDYLIKNYIKKDANTIVIDDLEDKIN